MACRIRHGATPRTPWKMSASAMSSVPAIRPPQRTAETRRARVSWPRLVNVAHGSTAAGYCWRRRAGSFFFSTMSGCQLPDDADQLRPFRLADLELVERLDHQHAGLLEVVFGDAEALVRRQHRPADVEARPAGRFAKLLDDELTIAHAVFGRHAGQQRRDLRVLAELRDRSRRRSSRSCRSRRAAGTGLRLCGGPGPSTPAASMGISTIEHRDSTSNRSHGLLLRGHGRYRNVGGDGPSQPAGQDSDDAFRHGGARVERTPSDAPVRHSTRTATVDATTVASRGAGSTTASSPMHAPDPST